MDAVFDSGINDPDGILSIHLQDAYVNEIEVSFPCCRCNGGRHFPLIGGAFFRKAQKNKVSGLDRVFTGKPAGECKGRNRQEKESIFHFYFLKKTAQNYYNLSNFASFLCWNISS